MKRNVNLNLPWRSFRRFRICACIETSRDEVGSSRTMNLGFKASALAITTRCLCPPLSWWGYRLRCEGLRPIMSTSSRIFSAGFSSDLNTLKGSASDFSIVSLGSREAFVSWKTICICRRCLRSSFPESAATFLPSNNTSPLVGFNKRMRSFPNVDLPLPDSPTIPRVVLE